VLHDELLHDAHRDALDEINYGQLHFKPHGVLRDVHHDALRDELLRGVRHDVQHGVLPLHDVLHDDENDHEQQGYVKKI
jgi:hypothetical protein